MMNPLEKFEDKMNEWQDGIRVLYKELQEFNNWSDDKVWEELVKELKRITAGGDFGEDDLIFTKEVLTSKRDIKLWEAVRLARRFKNRTPLLDALANLRNIN